MSRATWPTNRIIGEESCWAIWMPADALVAPGPRVTKQMPGRPVSLPTASAIIAAPPLLAADGDLDVAVVKRVEHGEIALAGHAEHVADALDDQLVDQHLGGGAQIVLGFHGRFPGMGIDENRGPKNEPYRGTTRTCPLAAAYRAGVGLPRNLIETSLRGAARRRTRNPEGLAPPPPGFRGSRLRTSPEGRCRMNPLGSSLQKDDHRWIGANLVGSIRLFCWDTVYPASLLRRR